MSTKYRARKRVETQKVLSLFYYDLHNFMDIKSRRSNLFFYHLDETDLIKYEHYFIMFGHFEYFLKHTRIHWNFMVMTACLYNILTQLIYATSDDNFEWFAVFAMLSGKIRHSNIGLTDKLTQKLTKW